MISSSSSTSQSLINQIIKTIDLNHNQYQSRFPQPTLNLLSCSTFLIATNSPSSTSLAWYTTPKEPLPMALVSVKEISCCLSGPWPFVATTVVCLHMSRPDNGEQGCMALEISFNFICPPYEVHCWWIILKMNKNTKYKIEETDLKKNRKKKLLLMSI